MELLEKQFDDLQDVHTGTWHMSIVVPVIFGLYIDFFMTLFIACVCFSFTLINPGNAFQTTILPFTVIRYDSTLAIKIVLS